MGSIVVWLAMPVVALALAVFWAVWAGRTRRGPRMRSSVEHYDRYRDVMDRVTKTPTPAPTPAPSPAPTPAPESASLPGQTDRTNGGTDEVYDWAADDHAAPVRPPQRRVT